MPTGTIYTGDCREKAQEIDASSVDLVLTDPPYGTVKGAGLDGWENQTTEWDESLTPTTLFEIANRILRVKGKLILFSQEPYTSELITSANTALPFSYRMVWVKDHYANSLQAKEAPVHMYEDVLVFTKQHDTENKNPLRNYFSDVLEYIGLPLAQINRDLGHRKAEHAFYIDSTQFELCTRETYQQLIDEYTINEMSGFQPYGELKRLSEERKDKHPNVFNLPPGEKYKPNVLEYAKDYDGHHPTQKPVSLLRDLIRTFSNNGDYVVDLTAGSGSTGVACRYEDREFTGIEKKPEYAEIARDRIGEEIENPEVLREHHNQQGLGSFE